MIDLWPIYVNRRTWGRGSKTSNQLRRSDNKKKCCLGFWCEQACGFSAQEITDRGVPDVVPVVCSSSNRLPSWMSAAIGANDRSSRTEEEREAAVTAAGVKGGFEFIFYN